MVERVEYQNAGGSSVMTEDGKRKKTFRQKRPKPDYPGEWLWNVDGIPPLIYRLPEVTEAIANGHAIVIAEGEAKADQLWSWNVPATCCSQGAGKWKAEHSEQLRGADIIILPDNDERGRDHCDLSAAHYGTSQRVCACLICPACRRRTTSSIGRRTAARSSSYMI